MNEIEHGADLSPATVVAPRPQATMRRGLGGRFLQASTPYLYVAPFFVIFIIFFAYPVANSLYVSMHNWAGQGPMKPVGWGNYSFVLTDNYFTEALLVTGIVWLAVPATLVVSLVIAVVWNHPRFKGRSIVLMMYLLPTVISIVAVSLVFRILYDPTSGPINEALGWVHLGPVDWLGDAVAARGALILVRIWETVGLGILFFASSLQSISADYYDAASVDGGGPVRQFFSITVPLLARTILFMSIWNTLAALSLFAEPNLIMSQGGPNNATSTIGLYLYTKVQTLDLGTASAVSFLMTLMMMMISVVLFFVARRWTHD